MHRSARTVDRADRDDPDQRQSVAVVIPVKSFEMAKERLSLALDPAEREELARTMAAGVVAAAAPLPVFVACGSDEVAAWAESVGASVIWLAEPGLNRAVTNAATVLGEAGFRRVIIAHGDLPLATSLAWVGDFDGVTIVPDRRGEGTNVMAIPLGAGFTFHYGELSAPAHRAEAERLGLPLRIVPDDKLGWDVDVPADLTDLSDLTDVTDVTDLPKE
ncbi:MAG: 2-phospho-L-lactate guanylyltransferase [Actinomycetota bacterium]